MRYLPPLPAGGRVLDVGFGSGAFMCLAKQVGWQVSGVDPDPVAVANGRKAGMDVRHGGIEAFSDALETFNVITLSHVIEHVHDPINTIKLAHSLLIPGGRLYIVTPNIDAYGHQNFKECWRGLEPPRHLTIFNWSSMLRALEEAGFLSVEAIYSFSPRVIRDGGDPYRGGQPVFIDKLNQLRIQFSPFSEKKKTEFITVIAHK
jgi:SAM-dependent methyltransferase